MAAKAVGIVLDAGPPYSGMESPSIIRRKRTHESARHVLPRGKVTSDALAPGSEDLGKVSEVLSFELGQHPKHASLRPPTIVLVQLSSRVAGFGIL